MVNTYWTVKIIFNFFNFVSFKSLITTYFYLGMKVYTLSICNISINKLKYFSYAKGICLMFSNTFCIQRSKHQGTNVYIYISVPTGGKMNDFCHLT